MSYISADCRPSIDRSLAVHRPSIARGISWYGDGYSDHHIGRYIIEVGDSTHNPIILIPAGQEGTLCGASRAQVILYRINEIIQIKQQQSNKLSELLCQSRISRYIRFLKSSKAISMRACAFAEATAAREIAEFGWIKANLMCAKGTPHPFSSLKASIPSNGSRHACNTRVRNILFALFHRRRCPQNSRPLSEAYSKRPCNNIGGPLGRNRKTL